MINICEGGSEIARLVLCGQRVRVGVLMSYVCIECRRRMFFDRRLQKWICTACGAECSASDVTNADTLPVSAVVASSTGAHANTNSLLVPGEAYHV